MLTLLYVLRTYNHHMNVHHELINLEKERFEANERTFHELFHISKKKKNNMKFIIQIIICFYLLVEYNQDEGQEPGI